MTSIESHPEQYWAAAGRPGPVPLALGPVHPGGPTLIDLLMALFGLSTNADLGGANADIEGDDTDRRAHAADAARKFSANEANAAEQMQGVGAQGMAQMASGIGGAAQRRARRRHGAADPAPATGDASRAGRHAAADECNATGPRR